jgi:hypothetical protein
MELLMVWLLYPSQAAAQADVAIIDGRMKFTNDITATWAIPRETVDGQWGIPAPDDTTELSGTPGTPNWPAGAGPA